MRKKGAGIISSELNAIKRDGYKRNTSRRQQVKESLFNYGYTGVDADVARGSNQQPDWFCFFGGD